VCFCKSFGLDARGLGGAQFWRVKLGHIMRSIFVISDLHLGGTYPPPGSRGFRLCTHADAIAQFVQQRAEAIATSGQSEIVLNGDTVDFLAERDLPAAGASADAPATWSAFTADPQAALSKFEAIVERDKCVFDGLSRFLAAGGRLTVLLGNHDVELSLPVVRDAFRQTLGVKPEHDFNFIIDGEGYVVGDALIEHGNRYDKWNQIDMDALRRIRSLTSRRQAVPSEYRFEPPAGSQLVVSVMNEIKETYSFIDLLKPENSAAVPILLALEPKYRGRLAEIAQLWYWTRGHGLEGPALPKFGGDVKAREEPGRPIGHSVRATVAGTDSAEALLGALDPNKALKGAIDSALGDDAQEFLRDLGDRAPAAGVSGSNVGARETWETAKGIWGLLTGNERTALDKRMRALLRAIRGLQKEDAFDTAKETLPEYLEAARDLAKRGFRYVVFGHTHQAKSIEFEPGRWYLNSGTWADVLRFPIEILKLPEAEALVKLGSFVEAMKSGDFSQWTTFRPTYVQLDIADNDQVTNAQLHMVSTAP
jgi:UDP-2,3-diacylglucosamine pyrophosphatase LpxH